MAQVNDQLMGIILAHDCFVDWPMTVIDIVMQYYRHIKLFDHNNLVMITNDNIKILPYLSSLLSSPFVLHAKRPTMGKSSLSQTPRPTGPCAWYSIHSLTTPLTTHAQTIASSTDIKSSSITEDSNNGTNAIVQDMKGLGVLQPSKKPMKRRTKGARLSDRQIACGKWERTNQLVIINQQSISFLSNLFIPLPSTLPTIQTIPPSSSSPSSSTSLPVPLPSLPIYSGDIGQCTCNDVTLISSSMASSRIAFGGSSAASKWLMSRNEMVKKPMIPIPLSLQAPLSRDSKFIYAPSSPDFRNPLTSGIIHKDWLILVIGPRLEYLDLNTLKW
jgi:hypothetical protein